MISQTRRSRALRREPRARIGVLVPPGNPRWSPRLYRMAPSWSSVRSRGCRHRAEGRRAARRHGGAHARLSRGAQGPAQALGEVRPRSCSWPTPRQATRSAGDASSRWWTASRRSAARPRCPAAQAVGAALHHLGVTRLALGTPYPESISRRAARTGGGRLRSSGTPTTPGVADIYSETEERAAELRAPGRRAYTQAQAVPDQLGTGLRPSGRSSGSRRELGKPVVRQQPGPLAGAATGGRERAGDGLRAAARRP
jgi:hypothetical protein